MLNILYLYNATQTFTNTVYEHLACFRKHSNHRSFFCHVDPNGEFNVDLSRFDAVAIHYSVRLPYDQVSPAINALQQYEGLKFLFIQDEYDHTHRAWHWIKTLGIQLVFTVVPEAGIDRIYPSSEFPNTKFVNVLTGYMPDELVTTTKFPPPSQRKTIVGYRGRPLPIRYGQLGIEKIRIGETIKTYCDTHEIESDIAWTEKDRIYGPRWYEFMGSCRSMLGTESGSNVFDWDGSLVSQIAEFRKRNPEADDALIYKKFVQDKEIPGIMNQVSPRIFEAIAARTVLVLYEGNYSGVVNAGEHFIAVKKDGSNIVEVLKALQDGAYVDAMADRAYRDVIESGKYSYLSFVRLVDETVAVSVSSLASQRNEMHLKQINSGNSEQTNPVTTAPIRATPPAPATYTAPAEFVPPGLKQSARPLAFYFWYQLPFSLRSFLKPRLKSLLG